MTTFEQYNKESSEGCTYPDRHGFLGLVFCSLKLCGEAGEVAEKVGKIWRDKDGDLSIEDRKEIASELGDVQWYLNRCAEEIGIPLEQIAVENVGKVQSRRRRNRVAGSGDNR